VQRQQLVRPSAHIASSPVSPAGVVPAITAAWSRVLIGRGPFLAQTSENSGDVATRVDGLASAATRMAVGDRSRESSSVVDVCPASQARCRGFESHRPLPVFMRVCALSARPARLVRAQTCPKRFRRLGGEKVH